MKYFFYTLFLMVMLCAILAMIFFVLQTKNSSLQAEKTAFECGFLMSDKSQKSFSISYFYMTIIFLIFDLEILILAPLMIFKANMASWGVILIIAMYFSTLLSFEWNNNMLEWSA